MAHFRANSSSILRSNSNAFKSTFLDVLRRLFPNKEVPANTVYIHVIKDKKHTHMNSTYWESLRGFCCHLRDHGLIQMRMTERGPMIKYLGKESKTVEEDAQKEKIGLQNSIELERERSIVQRMLQQGTVQTQEKETVEEQDVDTVINVEKKAQPKKVASLFSQFSRPKPPEKPKVAPLFR
ncbi:DNA/RNA-binding protein KIN17 [Histomonas meleagridis]|uniref:DNA/RNA-binding protein KIN17 n=1 Tax=Histomonas meleagridis TaxID=135588 RepID=UPI00355A57A7|nr:DNA/RNA-binding protein KIN17 [Histomonas meleagridis]KAH0802549.1 DNA/RNA-binding protein KIN17 [Histomonas meleagridis]